MEDIEIDTSKIQEFKLAKDAVKYYRNLRTSRQDYSEDMILQKPDNATAEMVQINCHRCYRLKKKCSREFPTCQYCLKTGNDCFYVDRKLARSSFKCGYSDILERHFSQQKTSLTDCDRCSKLKQKCSRDLPQCEDCAGADHECSYAKKLRIDHLVWAALPDNKVSKPVKSKPTKIINKLLKKSMGQSTQEEFINLLAFELADLVMNFVHNFFHNYEFVYPISDKEAVLKEVEEINFKDESLVSVKIYLILSIGCSIHDSIAKDRYFEKYFTDSIVSNLIDTLNFDDNKSFENVFLLTIYFMNHKQYLMLWNLVGILDRLVIRYNIKDPLKVVSVYNLDKDLSIVTGRPSHLPDDDLLVLDLPETKHNNLIRKFNEFYKLESMINNLVLRNQQSELKAISNEIENWRVSVTSLLHEHFDELHEHTTLVNLNYYYLCIELDELSESKSSQFVLQFLSQFFALILNDKTSKSISLSINNLLFYMKLLKVVQINAKYTDIPGYAENVNIIVNLLNYITNNLFDLSAVVAQCKQKEIVVDYEALFP